MLLYKNLIIIISSNNHWNLEDYAYYLLVRIIFDDVCCLIWLLSKYYEQQFQWLFYFHLEIFQITKHDIKLETVVAFEFQSYQCQTVLIVVLGYFSSVFK